MKKTLLAAVLILGAFSVAGVASAHNDEFEGKHRGFGAKTHAGFEFEHGGFKEHGKHRGEIRGKVFADVPRLVDDEIRADIRADVKEMSSEERKELREDRRDFWQERKEAFEEFVGMTWKELRVFIKDGGTVGEAIEENGHDEEDAKDFLEAGANARVDFLVDHHDLSSEQEETLRDRIDAFVEAVLSIWFKTA